MEPLRWQVVVLCYLEEIVDEKMREDGFIQIDLLEIEVLIDQVHLVYNRIFYRSLLKNHQYGKNQDQDVVHLLIVYHRFL